MTAEKGIVVALVMLWLGLGLDAAALAWLAQSGENGADQAITIMTRALIATGLAVLAWLIGRRQPAGTWPRRLSLLPVLVTGLLGLAVLARSAMA